MNNEEEKGKIFMNLLAVISSYFPSLTKSEQKVAQFILSNPDEIENYSINDLADFSNVGESTVIRFCRKVGFSGFQDFKLSIAKNQINQQNTKQKTNIQNIQEIIFQQVVESLEETKQFINEEDLEKASNLISKAEQINLFAVGNSGNTALDFKNRLIRLGKKVEFSQDSHLQAISASVMNKNDIAIAISISGNTQDILTNINIAKESGAKVIAVTNYLNSSITNLADVSLVCSSKEFISDYGSFSAKIAQLYLLDIVCKKTGEINQDNAHYLRNKTNKALINRIK